MIQGILLSIYWLLIFSAWGNTSINLFTVYFKFEVHATTVVLHDIQSSLAVIQFMNVFYFSVVCLFIFLVCHLKNKTRILMNNHFLHFLSWFPYASCCYTENNASLPAYKNWSFLSLLPNFSIFMSQSVFYFKYILAFLSVQCGVVSMLSHRYLIASPLKEDASRIWQQEKRE